MSTQEENTPADTDNSGGPPREQPDHHAGLWSALVQRVDDLTDAVRSGHDDRPARRTLVNFLRGDVLAHLESEEQVLYGAVRDAGAPGLVAALELDHRCLLNLVDQIEKADTALEAALSSRALVVLIMLRIQKEDTIILPTLQEAGADVSDLLDRTVVRMATDYGSRFTYF